MLTISDQGLALIQSFEGCRLTAYQDIVGVWTIGWGTIRINGAAVHAGMTITQEQADTFLREEANAKCAALQALLTVPQSQSQIDALTSFCYNLGVGAFQSSSLRKDINAGRPVVEKRFTDWNKVRQNGVLVPVEGLTRRRKAEYALYMKEM